MTGGDFFARRLWQFPARCVIMRKITGKEVIIMPGLTMETARQLLATTTTEDHLFEHAIGVSAAMGAMARHFGADEEYWKAVGYLHDYDYEQFPEEHLHHTAEPLREAGVDEESIRAILSHGWEFCTDVKPETDMEKSLFTVDELTGLVGATARMRPGGLSDLEVSSVKKKFKDKRFAAKIDRAVIQQGCDMLGMDLADVIGLCIEGMRTEMDALGLGPKE